MGYGKRVTGLLSVTFIEMPLNTNTFPSIRMKCIKYVTFEELLYLFRSKH